MRILIAALVALLTAPVLAAPVFGPPAPGAGTQPAPTADLPRPERPVTEPFNPMRLIGDAAKLLPASPAQAAVAGGIVPGGPMGPEPPAGLGRSSEREGFSVAVNIMILLTVLTLVPSVVLMTTCFMRILIVLALLRQAMGTQAIPPAQVVTALALFMTAAVMAPTIDRVWNEAMVPWQSGEIESYEELWDRAKQPVRDFMFDQIEATGNWSSVYMMLNYRGVDTSSPEELTRADVGTEALVPAYMLSELKVGFLMGFRVYLPFLVVDMVIASILISMSMMMLPPVLISLPFKLLLFVLADGWTLVVGSLLESFVVEGQSARASAEAATAALALIPLCISRGPPREGSEGMRQRKEARDVRRVRRLCCS